jgi:hypothetical protein
MKAKPALNQRRLPGNENKKGWLSLENERSSSLMMA